MNARTFFLGALTMFIALTGRLHRTARDSTYLQRNTVNESTRPEADDFENDDIAFSEEENVIREQSTPSCKLAQKRSERYTTQTVRI